MQTDYLFLAVVENQFSFTFFSLVLYVLFYSLALPSSAIDGYRECREAYRRFMQSICLQEKNYNISMLVMNMMVTTMSSSLAWAKTLKDRICAEAHRVSTDRSQQRISYKLEGRSILDCPFSSSRYIHWNAEAVVPFF